MPFIFIATPTTGGRVHVPFAAALIDTVKTLEVSGIKTTFANIDGSDVAEQRNALTQFFLDRMECTHILWIDSDMGWQPDLAGKLLSTHKPFVGAIYPRRKFNSERLVENLKDTASFDRALSRAMPFTATLDASGATHNGLLRLAGTGMGFTLIAREVFEAMQSGQTLRKAVSAFAQGRQISGFFDPIIEPDGRKLSEDLSFCRRWIECGGEIWGDPTANIKHFGEYAYSGSYMHHLKQR